MKKTKPIRYITEFDDYIKICELSKKGSPIKILFCTDDLPDKWFIDVVEYRNKTGVITDTCTILSKELEEYIHFCGIDGHTQMKKITGI